MLQNFWDTLYSHTPDDLASLWVAGASLRLVMKNQVKRELVASYLRGAAEASFWCKKIRAKLRSGAIFPDHIYFISAAKIAFTS